MESICQKCKFFDSDYEIRNSRGKVITVKVLFCNAKNEWGNEVFIGNYLDCEKTDCGYYEDDNNV